MTTPPCFTIGVLGAGTVGSGVITLLRDHKEEIARRVGVPLEIGPVLIKNPDLERDIDADFTTDPSRIIGNKDVDIVVEVIGGIEPANTFLTDALKAGQSVVTANKELVSTNGQELFEIASDNYVRLEYEASVAGAIPIIRPMRDSLSGDKVTRVMGILNGTTNFILTKMTDEGADFEPVLQLAQELGYAEADPTADVGGLDAAAKTAILGSIAFDTVITRDQVTTEGITEITAEDINIAKRLGFVIKLLGFAERIDSHNNGQAIAVRVHPTWVEKEHPLATVRGAYNAVFVEAEAAEQLMFYGPGAGSLPTASAVVGDVVSAARGRLAKERIGKVPDAQKPIIATDRALVQYMFLLDVDDRPGVLAEISAALGELGVSMKTVWQEGQGDQAQLLIITHKTVQEKVDESHKQLSKLGSVRNIASSMPVIEA